MRVIAGHLKGREFKTPHSHNTHPMSDKVRGAMFNVLGDIEGLTFLDAFAGSGALAIESVSRGAESVIAIDKDNAAHRIIEQNIKELHLSPQIKAVKASAGGWSMHNMEKKFDVVILAPPYDNLQEVLLKKLAKRHVKQNGLLVLDWPGKQKPVDFEKFDVAAQKIYGDAQLVFYRKRA